MVELIPVIEIGLYNTDVPTPGKGPYWDYPTEWAQYYAECSTKSGFSDPFPFYLPGSSFCKIQDISDNNLRKLVSDQTREMREGKYTREEACVFIGGYVLHIDGEDRYFPQCCGELTDIQYWQNLLLGGKIQFYQGHPQPLVTILYDTLIFDFSTDEFDEHFTPPVKDIRLEISKNDLAIAVDAVIVQLKTFSERLIAINAIEQLGILDIDKLLIWGDD